MRRNHFLAVLTAGLVAAGTTTTAQPSAETKPIGVDEDVLMRFFHEPEAHFHKAREQFFRRDYKGSAQSIRTAAGFVRLEGAFALPKGQETVNAVSAQLDKLARGVEDRSVRSVKALDQAFAGAHYAMGKNHNLKAAEHLARGNPQQAGKQLRAAVHHASHGYLWAGLAENDDVSAVFKKARDLAERLLGSSKDAAKDLKDVVDALNRRLEEIAKEVRFRIDLSQNM